MILWILLSDISKSIDLFIDFFIKPCTFGGVVTKCLLLQIFWRGQLERTGDVGQRVMSKLRGRDLEGTDTELSETELTISSHIS